VESFINSSLIPDINLPVDSILKQSKYPSLLLSKALTPFILGAVVSNIFESNSNDLFTNALNIKSAISLSRFIAL